MSKSYEIGGLSDQVTNAIERDEDLFLDVIDATLHLRRGHAQVARLRELLEIGASAYTVNLEEDGLVHRVDLTAAAAYEQALAPQDTIGRELQEAWRAAFGRNPNPSDAWDYAIKSVEDLLIPIVIPKVAKPNLGGVAGQLHSAPGKWRLTPDHLQPNLERRPDARGDAPADLAKSG